MSNKRTHRINASMFEVLESRQMMSAGDLDPTFGIGGKVIAQAIGFPAAAVSAQADGKVVAVGQLNNNFAVARLNANGTIDRTFGGVNRGNGVVTTDLGGSDDANAVAIQSDGKIIVAGTRGDDESSRVVVARYNPNGTLDG